MPLSKEAKAKYPADWKGIRAAILERAGHKCEWCGVQNHALGYREAGGAFVPLSDEELHNGVAEADGLKVIKIVLTIAHLDDPTPANCAPENLAALCQRCHLRHDAPMHARNAAATRRARREATGQPALLEATP